MNPCWWVTTRSKIWHPDRMVFSTQLKCKRISISLIRWKQSIFFHSWVCCTAIFFIGAIHKLHGQFFWMFSSLPPLLRTFLLNKGLCCEMVIWVTQTPLPLNCPRGLWMPHRRAEIEPFYHICCNCKVLWIRNQNQIWLQCAIIFCGLWFFFRPYILQGFPKASFPLSYLLL